jgi:signal recognition particle subunit SRP54
MSMIPGFSNMMGKNTEEESVKRIKRFMTIMDSMTAQELDSDNKIFNTQPSRITRIAMGAGVSVRAVHEVMSSHRTHSPHRSAFLFYHSLILIVI